jgi:hypothetical protein
MTVKDIAKLAKLLAQFLTRFADCFAGRTGRVLLNFVCVAGCQTSSGRMWKPTLLMRISHPILQARSRQRVSGLVFKAYSLALRAGIGTERSSSKPSELQDHANRFAGAHAWESSQDEDHT